MSSPFRHAFAALLLSLAYLGVLAAMDFHLCLNDFWAWSFLAERMDLADPSSFQNGFMPPAYALFLHRLGPSLEITGAFVATLLAVFVTGFAVARLAARQAVPGAASASILLLAVFAPFLQSGMTAGPDIVVAALVSVAAALHFRGDASARASLLAGCLCALAILVRTHALFAGLGVGLAVAVVDRRLERRALLFFGGVGLGLVAQVALNLAAGQPAWANDQAFNVYKMVHGVDWYDPVDPERLSLVRIVRESPVEFLLQWAGAILRAGAWLAGPALAWLVARADRCSALRRQAALAVFAGVVYTVPVALGDSPRTAVVISALVVPPVAALLVLLRRRDVDGRGVAAGTLLAFGLVLSLRADRDFLRHNFSQARDFAQVERLLREAGATRAKQVFTDDFDLYFRSLEGRRPLTRGGWGLIGIDGWEEEFPQLPTDQIPDFLAACRQRDVQYLALTRRSRRMGSAMAALRHDPGAFGASAEGVAGEFLVIRVPDAPPTPTP